MNAIAYRPSRPCDASVSRIASTAFAYFAGSAVLALLDDRWGRDAFPEQFGMMPVAAVVSSVAAMVCLWMALSTARRYGDRHHPGTAVERAWANALLVASMVTVVATYLGPFLLLPR